MSAPILPSAITDLSDTLSRLPGIGPKLAARLAVYLAVKGVRTRDELIAGLGDVAESIRVCSQCANLSESPLCAICLDEGRDRSSVLVVETVLDLYQIEKAAIYKGLYLVLGGLISPVNGVGVADLNIDLLWDMLAKYECKEVIIGFNNNVEGDATAMYISGQVGERFPGIKTSRLARGLGAGISLEYIDSSSLQGAFQNRSSVSN